MCPLAAAMNRGVSPSVLLWSLSAPDPTSNWTTSRFPLEAAMNRGVSPFLFAWSLLAPDPSRNRTTFRCPQAAACHRGVAPSALAWCMLARDPNRNRTTSRCPLEAAVNRGVAPFLFAWSLLAPNSTRNRTTSRCPLAAASHKGVVPTSVWPLSMLAPASCNRSTHLRLAEPAATNKGVLWFSSSKLGFIGWFKSCSSRVPSFWRHASMISCSFSTSVGTNRLFISFTSCRAKGCSSSSMALPCTSCIWNRARPIFRAKNRFNSLTEVCAKSGKRTFSRAGIGSPLIPSSTSGMGSWERPPSVKKSEYQK